MIYTAVLSKSQPHRVANLLGYQTLILQAYMEFNGDSWLGYDRTFRLKAVTQENLKWAAIDSTLWSLAFLGRGADRYCQCFSLHHSSSEYGWDMESRTLRRSNNLVSQTTQLVRGPMPVCYQWNRTPSPNCSFKNCKFEHKCSYCISNPRATDLGHKAINCPYHPDHHSWVTPEDKHYPRNIGK